MNSPSLNTILLATPKANITQAVGRILRQKPEERKVAPLIMDICDRVHDPCVKKFYGRRRFYKSCGYKIKNTNGVEEKEERDEHGRIEHVVDKDPFLED
jgi:hypothetical protein